MVSGQRRPLELGSRIGGQWRVALTALLALVAGAVAVAQILVVVRAWQLAGEELGIQAPEGEPAITRLTVMAEVLSYLAFQLGTLDVAVGAVAAAAAFALLARPSASAPGGGWRRAVWAVTVVVVAVVLATVLVRVLVQANWLVALDDGSQRIFGPPDTMIGLARLLGACADGLLWAAALIVGLLWRPDDGGEGGQDEDGDGDEDVEDGEQLGDHVELLDEPDAEPDVAGTGSAAPPSAYARPALPDPAPGPRLEADGSSDTGYDEFRFRR